MFSAALGSAVIASPTPMVMTRVPSALIALAEKMPFSTSRSRLKLPLPCCGEL